MSLAYENMKLGKADKTPCGYKNFFLLRRLNTIQSIGSFLRTKNGYRVTNPEGYVAIAKGGAVKLVDRLEFSRANFNMAKDWVKG